jgi:uncharacterized protein YciI
MPRRSVRWRLNFLEAPMGEQESGPLRQRLQSMLNADVVAIISRPRPGFDPAKLLEVHLDFMIALEKQGLLFLSGPLTGRDGKFGQFGLSVLNVRTIEEAEKIWADEPFFRAGQREAEFYVWRLMEGRLSLSFNLSDRSFFMREL